MRAVLIALAAVAFLAVSALVARWLTTDNAERAKVTRLLQAQARGDARGMLRELEACRGACAERAVNRHSNGTTSSGVTINRVARS